MWDFLSKLLGKPLPKDVNAQSDINRGVSSFTKYLQTIIALAAAIGVVGSLLKTNPLEFTLSCAILIVVVVWVSFRAFRRSSQPKIWPVPVQHSLGLSSYLRKLLPFEQGDRFYGRDQEISAVITLLKSLECRVGFLSGEAGAGKTSLLRAGVISRLSDSELLPIYVPRPGGDPQAAIRKELVERAGASGGHLVDLTLPALLQNVSKEAGRKTIVLILDQFEEFFVVNPTRDQRNGLEKALSEISNADVSVRLFFSLRKEFVDDLFDFARALPTLQDTRWRHPLRNFAPPNAREILRQVAADDKLEFSDDLQDLVIIDLTQDRQVRPVEFQIVLSTLQAQNINGVQQYKELGGAQGVIARFVKDVIQPPEVNVGELDIATARHTLRALCAKAFTTRRPIGLTRDELAVRLKSEIKGAGEAIYPAEDIDAALDRVIDRLLSGFILIREDEQRFNLAHDYLASPVRDATADIETVEERATRTLEQYIQEGRRAAIGWRTLRFIERFADPERKSRTDARNLFRYARRRIFLQVAGLVAVAAIAITIVLPSGTIYKSIDRIDVSNAFYGPATRMLTALDSRQHGVFIEIDKKQFETHQLPFPTLGIMPSPRGDTALALGTDHSLYQVSVPRNFETRLLIPRMEFSRSPFMAGIFGWAGYSPDGSWAFAVDTTGTIFAWPANGMPKRVMQLKSLPTATQPAPTRPMAGDSKLAQPMTLKTVTTAPNIGLSRDGRWLWVVDGSGRLYIVDPRTTDQLPAKEFMALSQTPTSAETITDFFGRPETIMDVAGRLLAVRDTSRDIKAIRLDQAVVSAPRTAIRLQGMNHSFILFAPSGDWLFATSEKGEVYAANTRSTGPPEVFPAIEPKNSPGPNAFPQIIFSQDGVRAAAFVNGNGIYVWQLDEPPRAEGHPISLPDPMQFLSLAFCGKYLMAGAGNGTVYSIEPGSQDSAPKPVGELRAPLQLRSTQDNNEYFAFDQEHVALGACGASPKVLYEQSSNFFFALNDSRQNLVLIGPNQLVRVSHEFDLWGARLFRFGWPPLAPL